MFFYLIYSDFYLFIYFFIFLLIYLLNYLLIYLFTDKFIVIFLKVYVVHVYFLVQYTYDPYMLVMNVLLSIRGLALLCV